MFVCCDMPLLERCLRTNKGLLRQTNDGNDWVGCLGSRERCWCWWREGRHTCVLPWACLLFPLDSSLESTLVSDVVNVEIKVCCVRQMYIWVTWDPTPQVQGCVVDNFVFFLLPRYGRAAGAPTKDTSGKEV